MPDDVDIPLRTYFSRFYTKIKNLIDTKAPINHEHGNINKDGEITGQALKNVVTNSNGKIITEDKPIIPTKTSQLTNDSNFLTQHQDISEKEDKINKVTSWSQVTSDDKYPSEKLVNDSLKNKIDKSSTNGLVKNDGTIDTNNYLTQHQDISGKVDKENGKGLSTNDYTTTEKNKLAGIETGANKTIVDSALSSSSTNPVQNKVINIALNNKVDKIEGKGLSTNDYTTEEKTKLSGIAIGANKTTVDSSLSSSSTNPVQNKVINTALGTKVDKIEGKGLSTEDYTTAEKTKLSGIETGANKTTVDSSLSSSSTNPVQNKVINSALNDLDDELNTKVDKVTGKGLSTEDYTTAEKTKLNGIEEGANNYIHPSYTARTGKPTSNQTPAFGGTATVSQIKSDATGHITSATDRTIKIPDTEASTTAHGLMSSTDKTKLDGVETGATKNSAGTGLNNNNGELSVKYGTGVGTACQGNDSRLSDARTPKAHNQASSTITDTNTYSNIGNVSQNQQSINTAIDTALSNKQAKGNYATSGHTHDDRYFTETEITTKLADKSDTTHGHGRIDKDGAIGSTANLPVITDTNGVLKTGTFGNGANTFCQGNDSRLSDVRNPKFNLINASESNPLDLNNYRTGGFYFCNNDNNIAPYISNCPRTGTNNKSFFLLVEYWGGNTYIKQTLTYYTDNKTYTRTKKGNSNADVNWSQWEEIEKANYEYIVGTQTASTASWTGTSTRLGSIQAGTIIYYKLPYASTSGTNVTLNLTLKDGTTTGAKNVWFWNNQRLTTHYGVNSVIGLIYNGTDWWVINPSSNANNNNYYLVQGVTITNGEDSTNFTAGNIVGATKDNKYYKLVSGLVLDVSYPLVDANTTINAGATSNNIQLVHPFLTTSNIATTVGTITANMPIYIEGDYYKGQFTISDKVIVCDNATHSTLTNNKYYIRIGTTYDATHFRFVSNMTVYRWDKTTSTMIPIGSDIEDLVSAEGQGGTNLIPNSQKFDVANGTLSTGQSELTNEYYKNCRIRYWNAPSNATGYADYSWNLPVVGEFKVGDKFTLSFWAKGTGFIIAYLYGTSGYLGNKPINYNDNPTFGTVQWGDGQCKWDLTSEWKRYFVTWHLNPNGTEVSESILKKLCIRTPQGSESYVCGVMFERGEVPHDWSPNPNDKAESNHTHDDRYFTETEINDKLANKSKVSFTQTKTTGIEIGKITIDGTSTSIYQQDNNTVYTHPDSGVTAGTNQNDNQTPSFNSTFNIPKLTFDSKGHITNSQSATVKLPALPVASTQQAGIIQIGTGSSNASAGNHTHDGTYIKDDTGTVTSTNILDETIVNGDIANNTIRHNKMVSYAGGGTSGTTGYVKILQIKVNSTYANVPITFDIYQRGSLQKSHVSLAFKSVNNTDPDVNSFTYIGNTRNIYIYKESTSTWSIIVQKSEGYDTVHINNLETGHAYMDSKLTFTALNTHVSTLPTTNITQATYVGFTQTEKTKLSGIETGATKTIIDSTPTANSNNAVSSGGVKTALDGKSNNGHTHSKSEITDLIEASTSENGLMSSTDKTNLNKLVDRYNGVFVAGTGTVNKPYLRLFNITAQQGSSSSSHLIFEIIGNNNDRLYAKIRVDMRQNDVTVATSASTYTITPLEVYGFDLNSLYFGFIDNHTNKETILDIYRKVGTYVNFYIRIADDHLRNGTYHMYSPIVNGIESYTNLSEASTTLYNKSYTSTSQGGTYGEVTNTIPYTNITANKFVKRGGTSSQVLKANGDVGTIVNDLTTGGTSNLLSAEQGKVLKTSIDSHTHDDRYYTETEVDNIGVEYIEGTHGATATPTWEGTSTKISSLQKGQVIFFRMTSAGTSAGDTLNLTLKDGTPTGNINIYYNASTKLTTHFPQHSVLTLVYDGSKWITTEIQNTNNYDRLLYTGQIVANASTKLIKNGLVCGKNDGRYYNLADAGTLDIRYKILWTGAEVAVNGNSNNVYSVYSDISLATTKSGTSVTNYKRVYIEGTALSGSTFTISSSVFKDDTGLVNGNYYIPIGYSFNNSPHIRFSCFENTVFHYTTSKGLVPYEDDKYAPISHATNSTTYGGGNSSNYGHVKLSDSYTSSGGNASQSVGASSKAVVDLKGYVDTLVGNINNYITS